MKCFQCFAFILFASGCGTIEPQAPQYQPHIFHQDTRTIDIGPGEIKNVGTYQSTRNNPAIRDVVLEGTFQVIEGQNPQIEFLVINETDLSAYRNNQPIVPIFRSGLIEQGAFKVSIPRPGRVLQLFDNTSSQNPKKVTYTRTITFEIDVNVIDPSEL